MSKLGQQELNVAPIECDENGQSKWKRPYKLQNPRQKWSEQEHKKFLEALKIHGRQWKIIGNIVKTKTAVQVRSHAQKYFAKLEKKYQNPTESNDQTREPKLRMATPSSLNMSMDDVTENQTSAMPQDTNRKMSMIDIVSAMATAAATVAAVQVIKDADRTVHQALREKVNNGSYDTLELPMQLLDKAVLALSQGAGACRGPGDSEITNQTPKEASVPGRANTTTAGAYRIKSAPSTTDFCGHHGTNASPILEEGGGAVGEDGKAYGVQSGEVEYQNGEITVDEDGSNGNGSNERGSNGLGSNGHGSNGSKANGNSNGESKVNGSNGESKVNNGVGTTGGVGGDGGGGEGGAGGSGSGGSGGGGSGSGGIGSGNGGCQSNGGYGASNNGGLGFGGSNMGVNGSGIGGGAYPSSTNGGNLSTTGYHITEGAGREGSSPANAAKKGFVGRGVERGSGVGGVGRSDTPVNASSSAGTINGTGPHHSSSATVARRGAISVPATGRHVGRGAAGLGGEELTTLGMTPNDDLDQGGVAIKQELGEVGGDNGGQSRITQEAVNSEFNTLDAVNSVFNTTGQYKPVGVGEKADGLVGVGLQGQGSSSLKMQGGVEGGGNSTQHKGMSLNTLLGVMEGLGIQVYDVPMTQGAQADPVPVHHEREPEHEQEQPTPDTQPSPVPSQAQTPQKSQGTPALKDKLAYPPPPPFVPHAATPHPPVPSLPPPSTAPPPPPPHSSPVEPSVGVTGSNRVPMGTRVEGGTAVGLGAGGFEFVPHTGTGEAGVATPTIKSAMVNTFWWGNKPGDVAGVLQNAPGGAGARGGGAAGKSKVNPRTDELLTNVQAAAVLDAVTSAMVTMTGPNSAAGGGAGGAPGVQHGESDNPVLQALQPTTAVGSNARCGALSNIGMSNIPPNLVAQFVTGRHMEVDGGHAGSLFRPDGGLSPAVFAQMIAAARGQQGKVSAGGGWALSGGVDFANDRWPEKRSLSFGSDIAPSQNVPKRRKRGRRGHSPMRSVESGASSSGIQEDKIGGKSGECCNRSEADTMVTDVAGPTECGESEPMVGLEGAVEMEGQQAGQVAVQGSGNRASDGPGSVTSSGDAVIDESAEGSNSLQEVGGGVAGLQDRKGQGQEQGEGGDKQDKQ